MGGLFDILFFAAIAAFFAYRLYQTLGKDDHEPDESLKEMLRKAQQQAEQQAKQQQGQPQDNVVTLHPDEVKLVDDEPEEAKAFKDVIKAIQKKEPDFSVAYFLSGAEKAFEMIIEAYAREDIETLEQFLAKEVYQGFEKDIKKRQKENKTLSTTVISGPEVALQHIELVGKDIQITVLFTTQEIALIKDEKGRILEGDPSEPEEVNDRWTFAKPLDGKTTLWKLVKTEA